MSKELRALTDAERVDLTRAIAESDITDGRLENQDIDALVDLFEAWLERRSTPLAVESALKELREMFPGDCPRIEFSDYRSIGGALVVNVTAGGLALGNNSLTLSGAMVQVRRWKESQKDQTNEKC